MAFALRQAGPQGPVGLDLDGSYVAAAQVSGGRIVRTASAELDPDLVRDGEIVDPAGLSGALREFFKQTGLPRKVRLGVANQQIAVRSLELPTIEDERERSAAIRFQAQDLIAVPLEEAVFDYQVVGETAGDGHGARMRVVVVAARESMITRLADAVRAAGLKPAAIDLTAFALVRTLGSPSAAGDEARVYCHLAGVTNLAIAVGSTCLFTRPLSSPRDEAGTPAPAALAEEIRLSINYYMSQPEARAAGTVVLSGPGSAREGFDAEIGDLLGLPIEVAAPLGRLDAGDLPPEDDPRRYTVAAGLALGAAA